MYFKLSYLPESFWNDSHHILNKDIKACTIQEKCDLNLYNKFSWMLCKNPASEYRNNVTKLSRNIYGKFINNATEYEIFVDADNIDFLNLSKKLNLATYVNSELSLATPYNMKGIFTTLRSAINGDLNIVNENLSLEDLNNEYVWTCTIGPCVWNVEFEKILTDLKFIYTTTLEFDNKINIEKCFMPTIVGKSKLSTFLQKIYILMLYSNKIPNSIYVQDDAYIEKLVKLSESWIDESQYKNQIITEICNNKKDFIKKFDNIITLKDDESITIDTNNSSNNICNRNTDIYNILKTLNISTIFSYGNLQKALYSTINTIAHITILSDITNLRSRFKTMDNVDIITTNLMYPKLNTMLNSLKYSPGCVLVKILDDNKLNIILDNITNILSPKYIMLYDNTDEIDSNIKNNIVNKLKGYTDENMVSKSVILFKLDKPDNIFRKLNHKKINAINSLYFDIYLPETNYTIKENEIESGFNSPQYVKNSINIFYMPPTIAPVEWDSDEPTFLEHPISAIKYYKDRGISKLIQETKYMGSRGLILYFKSKEYANAFGFENQVTINSRNGFKFFSDDEIINNITEELNSKNIDDDFLMLDCEILPWAYKAKSLIDYDYTIPGESYFLDSLYKNNDLTEVSKYLNTLQLFNKEHKIEIHPFHVLARGMIRKNTYNSKYEFKDCTNGYYTSHLDQMNYINWFINRNKSNNDIFKACSYYVIDLNNEDQINANIKMWLDSNNLYEGYIYKPYNFSNNLTSGYPIQPALKVRSKDYLRLVYGITYLDEKQFNIVKQRNINKKRAQANQQHELSRQMLLSFLHNDINTRNKLIAAFIGMEKTAKFIDATL